MNHNTKQCRYCVEGEVSFFTSFKDENGVTHYARTHGRRVFWKCSNPDCPGPTEGKKAA